MAANVKRANVGRRRRQYLIGDWVVVAAPPVVNHRTLSTKLLGPYCLLAVNKNRSTGLAEHVTSGKIRKISFSHAFPYVNSSDAKVLNDDILDI